MASEKFCLKWEDFAGNASNSFFKLRKETSLYDVTLVSNDHQQVSAHKLVLSACSEVFSNIFNSNNSPNMMLYLDSVDAREVNFMLDYIYQGEVKIHQDFLDRFLETATKFKLKGILGEENNDGEEDDQKPDTENFPKDKEEEVSNKNCKLNTKSVKPVHQTFKANNFEIEQKFREFVVMEGSSYRCTVCDKTSQGRKTDMRRHIETHLSGLSFDCSACGQSFRSSTALRHHFRRNHLNQQD